MFLAIKAIYFQLNKANLHSGVLEAYYVFCSLSDKVMGKFFIVLYHAFPSPFFFKLENE